MINLIGSPSLGVLVSFILLVTIVFMLAKVNALWEVTPTAFGTSPRGASPR